MTTTELGALIRESRESKGMSLSALARSVGFNRSYMSQIENGKAYFPHHYRLEQIEIALGMPEGLLTQYSPNLRPDASPNRPGRHYVTFCVDETEWSLLQRNLDAYRVKIGKKKAEIKPR